MGGVCSSPAAVASYPPARLGAVPSAVPSTVPSTVPSASLTPNPAALPEDVERMFRAYIIDGMPPTPRDLHHDRDPSDATPTPRVTAFTPRTRTLHVVLPLANPCGFVRRGRLFEQTRRHMLQLQTLLERGSTPDRLRVVTVEVVYGGTEPRVMFDTGSRGCVRIFVRVPAAQVLWAKENLVNCAIEWMRTAGAHYIAWVDADLQFSGADWVSGALDAIDAITTTGAGAFVQLFETATLLDAANEPMHTVTSFAAQHAAGKVYAGGANTAPDYWHPGFAWAADAATLYALADAHGGAALLERTLGGADRHMAMALLGRGAETVPRGVSDDYADQVRRWQTSVQARGVRLGVVRGSHIRHLWHGSLENRRYVERWDILARHRFLPSEHMMRVPTDATHTSSYARAHRHGAAVHVLLWATAAPASLLTDVAAYFTARDEDDMYRASPTLVAMPLGAAVLMYEPALPPLPPAARKRCLDADVTATAAKFSSLGVPSSGVPSCVGVPLVAVPVPAPDFASEWHRHGANAPICAGKSSHSGSNECHALAGYA